MPRPLSRLEQLAFAQLVDLSPDRDVPTRFAPNGSFVQARRDDAAFWYYQGYAPSRDGSPGARTRLYVGRVGDPDTEQIRRDHEGAHARYRERRRIAASLRRAGLPAPTPFDGAVIEAIASAGLFAAGAILVGSMAFQTYPGLVGTRLDDALMQTGDVDLAHLRHPVVRLASKGAPVPDLQTLLRDVDPTFEPILDRTHPAAHLGYRNKMSYKIEFLTTATRRTSVATAVVPLPGLAGVSAQPLRFLEYLLEEPVRSLVLHDDGVPVLVPDPARFAVHKLIVAHMRERVAESRSTLAATRAKVAKDVSQTAALVAALSDGHRSADAGLAWENAWRRGPRWREHLRGGLAKLAPMARDALAECVLQTVGPAAWPDKL